MYWNSTSCRYRQCCSCVENEDVLSSVKVNNLIIIRASKERQTLIGMVNKIIRKFNGVMQDDKEDEEDITTDDIVRINLIGTLLDKKGTKIIFLKEHWSLFRK